MASNPSYSKAIDSFLEYFKEAKPYHTKLLEVVEKYNFFESINADFIESIKKHVIIKNDPLCKQTGFGVDYDDNCGYDAIDCCDLFDCSGGYGVIFDNSDLVASEIMVAQNPREGYFEVEGNHTDDTRFQILSVPSSTEVVVKGDASGLLANHAIFLVVNMLPFMVVSNTENSLVISGNHTNFINQKNEFLITGTESNFNGKYVVRSSTYDIDSNQTTINFHSFKSVLTNDLQGLNIFFRNSEPNVGVYQVDSYIFDGVNTTITVSANRPFNFKDSELTEYQKGSIQFRTAFKYSREIDIDVSSGSEFHNVLYSEYIPDTNRTRIYVDGNFGDIVYDEFGEVIESLSSFSYVPGVDRLNMFGYFFNGGYDGSAECLIPKETHVYAMLEENLIIRVNDIGIPPSLLWVDTTSDWSISDGLNGNITFNGTCFEINQFYSAEGDSIFYGGTVSPVYGVRFELTLMGPSSTSQVNISLTTDAGSKTDSITITNGVPFLYELDQNSGVFDGVSGMGSAELNISPLLTDFYDSVILCNIEVLTVNS